MRAEVAQSSCECISCDFRDILFKSLTRDEFSALCKQKYQRSYSKGMLIVEEGMPIEHFLYLKNGLVKIHKINKYGKSTILNIGKPLDFLSLLTVFSDRNYSFSVTALEDTEVCSMNINVVKSMIQNNGKFACSLIEKMGAVSNTYINYNFNLNLKNLRGRIAFILLDFAENIYQNPDFDLPVSRREIGELIGMTTENVIRIFSEFRRDKIIKINGKNIDIVNVDKLRKISDLG